MKRIVFFIVLISMMSIIVSAGEWMDPCDPYEGLNFKSPNDFKWGNDIEVLSGNMGDFAFATDYRSGTIFAIVNSYNAAAPDTVTVYRSYDNGLTWSTGVIGALNGNGELREPQIFVTDNGKVACFVNYVETDGTQNLYLREFTDTSLAGSHFELVSIASDTVETFDVDYADNFYYVTYTQYDGAIYNVIGTTCHEDSSSWTNQIQLFANAVPDEEAKIAAGGNGYAYVAFIEDRMTNSDTLNIRVKRTYDYGNSWQSSIAATDLTGQDISDIDIAAARGSSKTVWISCQFNSFENWGYYYSTDSCANTTYSQVVSIDNGFEEHLGTMEIHPIHNWVTLAFKSDSSNIHNVAYGYIMNGSPTTVTDLRQINDYNATNTYRPFAGNILANSAVMYAGWGPTNLYFDTYINNLGIEDIISDNHLSVYASPGFFTDYTDICFTLDNTSNVSIEIYNSIGQRVWSTNTVFSSGFNSVRWKGTDNNGSSAPEGIYFFKVNDGIRTASGKITLF